jgi:hypothetical protein
MTTKPILSAKPLTAGGFHIRCDGKPLLVGGKLIAAGLDESTAWGAFLNECRTGRFVELVRGRTVVASSR